MRRDEERNLYINAAIEQFNGREAKTATLFLSQLACVFAHVISTVICFIVMWSSGTGHKAHAAPLIFNFQLLFKFHRAFVAQTGM